MFAVAAQAASARLRSLEPGPPRRRQVGGGFFMAPAKKRRSNERASKPSAAAEVRAALDPNPPRPSSDVPLPERRRAVVERARPPPLRLLPQREVCALVGV